MSDVTIAVVVSWAILAVVQFIYGLALHGSPMDSRESVEAKWVMALSPLAPMLLAGVIITALFGGILWAAAELWVAVTGTRHITHKEDAR